MPAPDPFTEPNARRQWLRDQLHRKRVARDGERISFATIADHAAHGFSRTFSDGSPDYTNPHRPGFRFADNGDQPDDEDDVRRLTPPAKEESAWLRRQALALKAAEATMGKDYRHRVDARPDVDRGSQQPMLSLDELEQAATVAYEDRSERMRNAWRRP